MRKSFFKKTVAIALTVAMMIPSSVIAAEGTSVTNANSAGEYNDSSKWSLVWSDEFEGTELDTNKWSYETGSGHNNEKQYYTKDNVSVSDGTLKITAKEESMEGYPYTSGRIETITGDGEKLFATKYGKIEAKIKLPAGTGLWPAFWMMPADNVYGGWPLSGEIDIMEARGRLLNEVNGTIHFGEKRPFNRSLGGSYTLPSTTDITEYHVYGVEWRENLIIWYVDGVEFYRTSNWYTMTDGVVAEYPAPFNQEFYLILNLAVGGDYDSGRVPSSSELPGTMEVDYVRVYHNVAGYSSSNIYMPEGARDDAAMSATPVYEDGNLLSDINFTKLNSSVVTKYDVDLLTHDWYLMTNKYSLGAATATTEVINGVTFANIDITDPGANNYSVQLKQLLPLAQGYLYNVTFDAKSNDGERSIKVKPIGETNYRSSYVANLTTEIQSYQFSFIMEYASDADATLEFNLGQYEGDVSIGNVRVTVVDTYNAPEGGDSVANGSSSNGSTSNGTTSNGTTSEGSSSSGLTSDSSTSEGSLNGATSNGSASGSTSDDSSDSLTSGDSTSGTTSDSSASNDSSSDSAEGTTSDSTNGTTSENGSESGAEEETTIGSTSDDSTNGTTSGDSSNGTTSGDSSTENGSESDLEEDMEPINYVTNGDFSDGMQIWKAYDTSYALEHDDGNLYGKAYAKKMTNPWDRQWLQKGIFLTEGKTYKLEFKAKCSSSNQKFAVVVEDADYDKDLYEEFRASKSWKTYSFEFTASSDGELALRYYLGMVSKSCKLYLDDVSIMEVE